LDIITGDPQAGYSLYQFVLVLASKSEIIEDDLLSRQLDNSCEETKDFTSSSSIQNTGSTAISCSLIFLELVLETHQFDFEKLMHIILYVLLFFSP
jgi:hypothetical protein